MTPADLLEKVADDYESGKVGWRQDGSRRVTKSGQEMCVVNALHLQCYVAGVELRKDSLRQHQKTLGMALTTISAHNGARPVASWNDDPATTKELVIDTLKAAAKDLRNEETP